jgi:hypothetical protein
VTPPEAVLLCRYAKACCPQQAFDEYTSDAWYDLLGDMRFVDCKEGVRLTAQRQPFVSPSEIRNEVKRIRFDRIQEFGPIDPPAFPDSDDASSEREYREWMRETYRRIGDGMTREEYEAERPELPKRQMPALDHVFRHVPEGDKR